MTSPTEGSLALESVTRIERERETSLENGWTYLQGVLDEALSAVQCARVRNAQMNTSLDRFRNRVSELEDLCASLQLRVEESEAHAESADDTLDQLRREHDEMLKRNEESAIASAAYRDLVKHTRRLEGRLRGVMEAIDRLDRSAHDIQNHYGNDVNAIHVRAEEVNFARDEALQRIRRAIQSLYNASPAQSSDTTRPGPLPEPERASQSSAALRQYR
jgi:DNA repair exonuclease SbcCD ATPase subunit